MKPGRRRRAPHRRRRHCHRRAVANRAAKRARVDGFWIDATEITNDQFRKFVEATGYVTTAERKPSLEEIMAQVPPGTPPPSEDVLVAGSMVFTVPDSDVDLRDFSQWWK